MAWHCVDCGVKKKGEKAERCVSCSKKHSWDSGVYGKRREANNCIDCGVKKKSDVGERCISCTRKNYHSKGVHWTDERKRAFSESLKARWAAGEFDEVFPERRRSQKKFCVDCGVKIDYRATRCPDCASVERANRPETKRAAREYLKKRWRDPIYRAHMKKKMREAHDRPGNGWQDEEFKKRMSEKLTADWATGKMDYLRTAEWSQRRSKIAKEAWLEGVYDTPEYREKLRAGVQRRVERAKNGESWHPEGTRQKISEGVKRAWERGDFDGIHQSPTSIEIETGAALDMLAIDHMPQYRPDNYTKVYDEFVPPDILIEVHGDYWHSREDARERDKEKSEWADEHGYTLLVFWEHEIREIGAWALVVMHVLPLLAEGVRE